MREQSLLGQQIGNYQLIRMLGRGGFAEVYLGEHLHLGTHAAIKVLHTALVGDKEIEYFRSEARMVAHLVHPHIVQVLEFGIEGKFPYLVMRYAPGGTLRHRHPKGSQVPLTTLVTYVNHVASALQYAHDASLIHRDVKPENMLIGSTHEILLSDFGIALVAQSSRSQHSQQIAGTAIYMAPEQFQGKARTASDQYALGVVVYEWLTGEQPFKGTFSEVASQHIFTPPPSLREQIPGVSADVEWAVLKALEKDPNRRFGSVWEFATALEHASATDPTGKQTFLIHGPSAPLAFEQKSDDPVTRTPTSVSQANTTPLARREESPTPVTTIPTQKMPRTPLLSRRALLLSSVLTGLAGAGIATGVVAWLSSQHTPSHVATPPTPRSIPTARPTAGPTPPPMGTTLTTYSGHQDVVEAAAWSPDSKRIVSASKDRTVQVWDAASGNTRFTYTGHTNTVDAVAWSPDGKRIASGSLDKTVQVWDATDGGNHFIYTEHTDTVAAIVWSPDGRHIASGGADHTIQVWDAANGTLSFQCSGHSGKVWTLAWSPDGKYLASASADKTVRVWDATTGANTFVYKGHTGVVDAVAWSPNSKRIASSSYDKTVQVWDAADGGHPYIYTGHSAIVWWQSWSPDGQRIVSVSDDHTAQVWDAANGGHLYTYHGQDVALYFVAWSPDGTRILSGGNERTVTVWQAE